MKQFTQEESACQTLGMALRISDGPLPHANPITFHCAWHGVLNDKHYGSILSCWVHHVLRRQRAGILPHRIVLWIEGMKHSDVPSIIRELAEVRELDLQAEIRACGLLPEGYSPWAPDLSHRSDLIRYMLLHNYGGCWFDLDVLFLRNFDPLLSDHAEQVCVYRWERQPYPNGAIFWSLEPRADSMAECIRFVAGRNRGWGFQIAELTYDLPLPMLVLPCAWFDPDWLDNTRGIGWDRFFQPTTEAISTKTFFPGAFAYHWHNRWNVDVPRDSPFGQLVEQLEAERADWERACVGV